MCCLALLAFMCASFNDPYCQYHHVRCGRKCSWCQGCPRPASPPLTQAQPNQAYTVLTHRASDSGRTDYTPTANLSQVKRNMAAISGRGKLSRTLMKESHRWWIELRRPARCTGDDNSRKQRVRIELGSLCPRRCACLPSAECFPLWTQLNHFKYIQHLSPLLPMMSFLNVIQALATHGILTPDFRPLDCFVAWWGSLGGGARIMYAAYSLCPTSSHKPKPKSIINP